MIDFLCKIKILLINILNLLKVPCFPMFPGKLVTLFIQQLKIVMFTKLTLNFYCHNLLIKLMLIYEHKLHKNLNYNWFVHFITYAYTVTFYLSNYN